MTLAIADYNEVIRHGLHVLLSEQPSVRTARRLMIFHAGEGGPGAKGIDDSDLVPLATALQTIEPGESLDLLLISGGGRVNVSRRICLLLRERAGALRVWAPFKARSSATLLCLGADENVLGPLGELGPLDPQMIVQGDPVGGPQALSPEDVRAFLRLSDEWLELNSPEQRLELLRIVATRVFPLTLGTIY